MNMTRQITAALQSQIEGGKTRPPEAGILLWNTFAHLSKSRSWHAHGPNPISFPEIEAYCRLMRLPLAPRHIEVIRAMDEIWISHTQDQLAPRQVGDGKRLPPRSRSAISAPMFDAMFT